jgi:DUF4097 and DUF4098 domain-containing protein YvlB
MRDVKMLALATGSTAIGLTLMVMSVGGDMPLLQAVTAQERQREIVLHQEFSVAAGGSLIVDVADADVIVETGTSNAATVDVEVHAHDMVWGREVFDRMEFEAELEGDVLTIHARDPHAAGHEWRQHKGVGVTAQILIPDRFDVRVITGDGDVSLTDLAGQVDMRAGDGDIALGNITGSVSIRTGDGDVTLGALQGDVLSVHSADGDITAQAVMAEQIELETSDGDVWLRSVSGPLRARTSDGDIEVLLAKPAPTNLRTGDGDITIATAGPFGLNLDIRGESIHLPQDLMVQQSRSRRSAQGEIHGGGPDIKIATGDGSVRVRIGDN